MGNGGKCNRLIDSRKEKRLLLRRNNVSLDSRETSTMLVNNISGSYKTGFAVAVELGIGNVGGIASALIFQQKQAPLYLLGWKTTLGMTCSAAGLVIVYTFMLWRENKARNAGKRDHRFSSPEIDNMGDDHPEFRYGY